MGPERKIQVKVIDYARKRYGALCKKSETGKFGSTGWPDYLILGHEGVYFFIEFKAPGGKLTPLQQSVMKEIERRGHQYYIVDDADEGKRMIDEELGP